MPKSLPDELYHYTGIHGLKGIIESQTLWATHYKYLNDAEETIHFRDRLPQVLRPVFENMFSGLNPAQKQLLANEYGSIDMALEEEPRKLATTIYDTTFGGMGAFASGCLPSYHHSCNELEADMSVSLDEFYSHCRAHSSIP